jgi:alkylhydroperoxidase/carboxymuconolactone decarboxylase family protein YurZ
MCEHASTLLRAATEDDAVMFRDERDREYPRFSKRVIDSYRTTGINRGMETATLAYGLDPDFTELCMQYTRGGMYAREVVSPEMRELIAIACLTVRNALPQLETHVKVTFRLGLERAAIQEILLQR